MKAKGANSYDRKMYNATRSFERWFNQSLARELVAIDNIEQYAVFQDHSQSNNKELSDDKYMITENKSNVKVGSVVNWRDSNWLVFTEEHKTIPTHKQTKVKESNHRIKWMIGDKVCNHGVGHHAYIQNQTLYTLGVSTSGHHGWIVDAKMMMYLQDNEETRNIKIGQRIFIGGAVYQIMFKDYVSRSGLINYLLEQDMINPSRDNIELEIADYYTALEDDFDDEIDGSNKEIVIRGSETAKIGSTNTFSAVVYDNGIETPEDITEWVVGDSEGVASVIGQTVKDITVRIESNFQKVGSVISIIGKTSDGAIGSKSVRIISPY